MRVTLVLVTALWTTAAIPQEAAEEEGSSGLAGLLERSLSSDNMRVRVEGLEGALSSEAQIERISFADTEGIWLTIENAVLDWNRAALLRGRVSVNRLEARRITVERTPVSNAEPELPSPTARQEPFSLPELPVSISIGTIAVPEIVLGEGLLGEQITATIQGGLEFADGSALVDIDLQRTDIDGTRAKLIGGFSNETSVLDVDVALVSRPDGLLARKLNIPGAPSLDLTVLGSGPLSDFEADIALRSDNSLRLGGTVGLVETDEGPKRLTADIAGDVRPLLAPDLGDFFGPETAIRLSAVANEDGTSDLERLHIVTEAFDIAGKGRLGANGWPENIALTGIMGRADGRDVRLPVAGPALTLNGAKLGLYYDAAQGSVWSIALAATDVVQEQIAIGTADVRGAGTVTLPSEESAGALDGRLLIGADGVDLGDPDLNEAAGAEVRLSTQFAWTQGGDFDLKDLELLAGGAKIGFDGMLALAEENLPVTGQLSAEMPNLGRYAALVGQELSGGLAFEADASATLLTGAFDVALTGSGRELRTGIAPVDQLLLGSADISFDAGRSTDGLALREASVSTPAVVFDAEGRGSGTDASLQADLRLDNLGRLVPEFPGPVTVSGTLAQVSDGLSVDLSGEGPAGTTLSSTGTIARDFSSLDLSIDAAAALALANPFLNPITALGDVTADLQVSGPPELSSVSGQLRLSNARIAEPTVGIALLDLNGQVDLSGAAAQIALSGQGNRGGTLSVNGGVGLSTPTTSDLLVALEAFAVEIPGTLTTSVDAEIGLNGTLPQDAVLAGLIELGETEIRIPDGGAPDAIVEDITHVGDRSAAKRTRERAGLGPDQPPPPAPSGGTGGIGLNLNILAENRVFIRGYGLDAELTGDVEVLGTTNDPRPVGEIELVRGRLAVLGQRLDLDEGRIQLLADLIPDLYFAASSTTDTATVTVAISGPANEPEFEVTSSPPLPEDEALAQLLFGRSLNDLSGFQALQLANSVIALRNGTGLGVINQLRENTGLDDFDLDSDGEGNTNLRVGKYLTEDIYTNVDVNSSGQTGVSLNIDLTNSLTARGTVTNDGDDSLGLFFERDY
ncbi:translocation/assembly module TamB domain-containing protein [Tropicimonas sp. S265A]|uniref:translocation/assembly module TamB domain-containing protein n=1 Tax=Tropicimonas sp. S265A TaxID=3415134 RepID=UPI003C7BD1B0